jgi:predicted ribosome quality control (RQC) complex YloA/Tae2 family protein
MNGDQKSTDPGLSVAERKALRAQEAQEAIAHQKEAQKAFRENRERLREERGRQRRGRCSIRPQNFRTTHQSKTFDFLREFATR